MATPPIRCGGCSTCCRTGWTDPNLRLRHGARPRNRRGRMRSRIGPYTAVAEALTERVAPGGTLGARRDHLELDLRQPLREDRRPRLGVHALGGGIGQGVAMGVGAALARRAQGDRASRRRRHACWACRDDHRGRGGGAARLRPDERPAYGVIRNIQDAQYDGRHHYSALRTPDFAAHCAAIGLPHRVVREVGAFAPPSMPRFRRRRTAARRGRHGRHRPLRRKLLRPARRRGRQQGLRCGSG
jgi:acetolactate synthase I/II/III large subunit